MTDREERQHVIEVLKQMRLDYEDFWEENDTEEIKAFNYAIASIETNLKYDLLYEETSGQADKQADKPTTKNDVPENNVGKIKPTTKKDLAVDAVSRKAVQTRLKEIINEMETIFADIREREVNDSVCGLCEYDCDHGLDGFANECPGFEKDDCFKLNEKYKAEWLDISNLPSVTPQLSSGLEKNSKKLEKDFGESDCISREQAKTAIRDRFKDLPSRVEINTILNELPSVTPQEPRKGHWIEHPRTKELRFHHIYECSACKTQIIGNRYNVGNYKYCPHCGIEFEVEG